MSGKKQLIIEPAWCKGCGICAEFCPKKALELFEGRIRLREDNQCILCGMCEMRCPDYAIYLVNSEE